MSIQRTARGQQVDMSALATKNEKVRAVGNMNVNARGDVVDPNNRVINDNTQRVKNSYKKSVAQGQSKSKAQVVTPAPKVNLNELTPTERELEQDIDDIDEEIKK